jgi:radical SAM superfamily enzyme YgiQ (UPF0313 family)
MPEVKEIVFEDDTFTSDRPRAREIARLVRERNVSLPFFANVRCNVDYETLAALRDSGLRECAVGFESGDNMLLANMRKGQNVEMQHALVDNCRKLGILVHGCFMVGFPGETRDTMKQTLVLALALDPDSAQFYPVMPYPGTGAYQWAHDQGYLATSRFDDWLTSDGGHRCVLNLPGLSPGDIERFCEDAFRRFHFRPKYLLRKARQALTNPHEGRRSLNAGLNFLRYLFSNERTRDAPFSTNEIAIPNDWAQRQRVPYGRMERMERALDRDERGRETGFAPKVTLTLLSAEKSAQRR